ncbi:troponin I-like isoform X3 [Dermacentor silvarum]|uniref:troponin I-like isoform X3 n=1 Tax=Dermacentor silvarum TaxID=543639 RepID=UPI002100EBCE|nr:troponin I-like isoform X3 [Dermacentor silvarum]
MAYIACWRMRNTTVTRSFLSWQDGLTTLERNHMVVDRTRKKGKDRASYRGGIMAELVERGKKRQREEEKEEQAADAATERELKRRQDAMTLEEIREQVQEAEKKLAALVAERLQLFMQLEKVLREEEAQKRALEKEANN